jgi:hypothetical protein
VYATSISDEKTFENCLYITVGIPTRCYTDGFSIRLICLLQFNRLRRG